MWLARHADAPSKHEVMIELDSLIRSTSLDSYKMHRRRFNNTFAQQPAFLRYVNSTFLDDNARFPPGDWLPRDQDTTNNYCESHNAKIKRFLSNHPTILTITKFLHEK